MVNQEFLLGNTVVKYTTKNLEIPLFCDLSHGIQMGLERLMIPFVTRSRCLCYRGLHRDMEEKEWPLSTNLIGLSARPAAIS